MNRHTILAAAVMLVGGVIAFQSIRADAVTSGTLALTQSISPLELMLNTRDLPVESVDSAV